MPYGIINSVWLANYEHINLFKCFTKMFEKFFMKLYFMNSSFALKRFSCIFQIVGLQLVFLLICSL